MALFKDYAHGYRADGELFGLDSWTQVMFGYESCRSTTTSRHGAMKEKDLTEFLSTLRANISQAVALRPSHQEFVNQYCKAPRAS